MTNPVLAAGVAVDKSLLLSHGVWRVGSNDQLRDYDWTAAWVIYVVNVPYYRDSSDTTSVDDDVNIIVDDAGNRWKKIAGSGVAIDAAGPVADLSDYDDEEEGFIFYATDEFGYYIKESATSADWSDLQPIQADPIEITAVSTSSLSIGTGSKAFTVLADLGFTAGMRLRAASDDGTKFMEGVVASYSSTTLTLTVDRYAGTGTHADWNIGISGQPGATAWPTQAFAASTSDGDPGAGTFRIGASDNFIYADNVGQDGGTLSALFDLLNLISNADARGILHIVDRDDASIRKTYKVTGDVIDGTGYRKIPVSAVGSAAGTFVAGRIFTLSISLSGNDGEDGVDYTPTEVVATYADKAAFNGLLKGQSVLVEEDENEDGQAYIYFKLSNTSGDWSGAIPFNQGTGGGGSVSLTSTTLHYFATGI